MLQFRKRSRKRLSDIDDHEVLLCVLRFGTCNKHGWCFGGFVSAVREGDCYGGVCHGCCWRSRSRSYCFSCCCAGPESWVEMD
ncbi:hypothetical protein FOMG_19217 [Fusarium oxysporum f. sp. melonis 26406]|uniref:Uncharacterized protein n=1 Tax=Fusarium oxysporum f. sp. melonis 26406 TaxID=1089452 RepID=W9YY27_FUSOX|nr:hypothetical protein FOMG_19217 [Fusarium oxysporum f. sp. melonis 26406]